MKRARKNRQKENNAPVASSKFRQGAIIGMVALVVTGAYLAASARNGLHESAVKIASDKMQREMLLRSNPQPSLSSASDVDSKNTKTPDVPIAAPMPPKAKSVKTREEANKIVAQLTNTNSAITYDPWGRIAKLVEPDSSVRQLFIPVIGFAKNAMARAL